MVGGAVKVGGAIRQVTDGVMESAGQAATPAGLGGGGGVREGGGAWGGVSGGGGAWGGEGSEEGPGEGEGSGRGRGPGGGGAREGEGPCRDENCSRKRRAQEMRFLRGPRSSATWRRWGWPPKMEGAARDRQDPGPGPRRTGVLPAGSPARAQVPAQQSVQARVQSPGTGPAPHPQGAQEGSSGRTAPAGHCCARGPRAPPGADG